MSTRREFLERAVAGVAWLGTGGALSGVSGLLFPTGAQAGRPESAHPGIAGGHLDDTVVTILHTNDVHSRIDPFPEGSGRYAGLAGAARRATLVRRTRAGSPHILLLDAGDAFQGTPYFNLFNGEADFRVMSAMGYEAMAIGNHEFDAGLDGLVAAYKFAEFPLLSANYDVSGTVLADIVRPYTVRTCGPVRVGIFGLSVILEGLVAPSLCRGVRYSDPVAAARRMATHLRSTEKCDLVICLSHLGDRGTRGEPGDQRLAREVTGIDLIVGGHSHTFMDEPTRVRHEDRETLVFQVGWGGINLGRVDFHLRQRQVVKAAAWSIPVGDPEPAIASPAMVRLG